MRRFLEAWFFFLGHFLSKSRKFPIIFGTEMPNLKILSDCLEIWDGRRRSGKSFELDGMLLKKIMI